MTKLSLAYLTTEAHWQEKKNFIVAAEENSGSWKLKYLWTPWFRNQSVSSLLYKKRSLCGNYTFIKQTLDFNTIILTKIFYLLRTHKIFSPLSVHICPLPSGGYFSIQHFFSKYGKHSGTVSHWKLNILHQILGLSLFHLNIVPSSLKCHSFYSHFKCSETFLFFHSIKRVFPWNFPNCFKHWSVHPSVLVDTQSFCINYIYFFNILLW